MENAKNGDKVRVHYTGWLEDGTQIDTSEGGDPLEFTLGAGEIIPGFETIVLGMEPGEVRKLDIQPEAAYGPYDESKIQSIDKTQFPEEAELEIGQQFQATREDDGESVIFSIMDVEEESVIVDANHPLAGQTLTFEVELVEIAA